MSATSARGLFKATGNRAKPKSIRLLDGSYAKTESVPRQAHDFNPTPPEPTRSLLFRERDRLSQFPLIWESACGDGRMMRDIEEAGHKCIGSDLIDRGCNAIIRDFFAFDKPLSPAIVTNPPFNLCNARDGQGRWIWHALDVLKVEYMALLLNWSWPGAGGLAKLWQAYPPATVYLMRWKIDFTGEGQPPMLNAWFIWDRQYVGETRLRMMDRVDARQSSMLEVA
jgi:hypothetical protein